MMTVPAKFAEARKAFHAALLQTTLTINSVGIVSNADGNNSTGKAIAKGIAMIVIDKMYIGYEARISGDAGLAGRPRGEDKPDAAYQRLKVPLEAGAETWHNVSKNSQRKTG